MSSVSIDYRLQCNTRLLNSSVFTTEYFTTQGMSDTGHVFLCVHGRGIAGGRKKLPTKTMNDMGDVMNVKLN
jgi:hypothetical protein